MEQLTASLRVFVQYWKGCKLGSGIGGEVTPVGEALSTMKRYLGLNCRWYGQCVFNKLGDDREV